MAEEKKKKVLIDEAPGDPSIVLFVALGMILLAFFIVLNSIAVIEESKVKEAIGSLIGSFGVLSGGVRVEEGVAYLPKGPAMATAEEGAARLAQQIRRIQRQNGTVTWGKQGAEVMTEKGFDVEVKGSRVEITFTNVIVFVPGEAEVRPAFCGILQKISAILRMLPHPIVVEGHTDDLPIHSDQYRSNWHLSAARAVSVVKYLLEVERISMYRLSAVGYGEFRPLVPNTGPEERERNRRVNIIIDMKLKPMEPPEQIDV